jgi:hypothetical protein
MGQEKGVDEQAMNNTPPISIHGVRAVRCLQRPSVPFVATACHFVPPLEIEKCISPVGP